VISEPSAGSVGSGPGRVSGRVDGVLDVRDDALMEKAANVVAAGEGSAVERTSVPGDGVVALVDRVVGNQVF
jgi:hypothetical protein